MKRLAILPLLALAACESPQPPAACGPLPQVTVNAGETATATACFNDPNGDALVYSATSSNPAVATVSVSGTVVTVAAVAKGGAVVIVTATDPGGLGATQSFQVTVPNRAPVSGDPIPDIEMFVGDAGEGDVSGFFTDPDGDALSYTASTSDAGVAVVSVSGSTLSVTAVSPGSATVTVSATDPDGLAATQTFDVAVDYGYIVGQVSVEGTGIDGVTVTVRLWNEDTTTTSGGGSFRFEVVEVGRYVVTISDYPSDVSFQQTSTAANISSVGDSTQVVFRGSYIRTSRIVGRVSVDDDGLAGVTVSVSGPSDATMTTSANGQFGFTGLRAGDYTVSISGYDTDDYEFEITSKDVTVGVTESATVNFEGHEG